MPALSPLSFSSRFLHTLAFCISTFRQMLTGRAKHFAKYLHFIVENLVQHYATAHTLQIKFTQPSLIVLFMNKKQSFKKD